MGSLQTFMHDAGFQCILKPRCRYMRGINGTDSMLCYYGPTYSLVYIVCIIVFVFLDVMFQLPGITSATKLPIPVINQSIMYILT